MNQVNVNIRRFRELMGLTREQMASELNMSPSGFGKIERGEVDITIPRLLDISRVLNVHPSSLIFFDVEVFLKSIE
jgi:transcriptional regulator with XRE-family HTH domain